MSSPKVNFPEKIFPGQHAYNGSYTQLEIEWEGQRALIETATVASDFFLHYRPLASPALPHILAVVTGILWNLPGSVSKGEGTTTARLADTTYRISATVEESDFALPLPSPYFSFSSDREVAVYTGSEKTTRAVAAIIEQGRLAYRDSLGRYGDLADAYEAMQSVMAWNLIYDASNRRGLASASRIWNEAWGGYIIFD